MRAISGRPNVVEFIAAYRGLERAFVVMYCFPHDDVIVVITHKGRSSNSGHYVMLGRLQDDEWAMCDDVHVNAVTSDQVLKLSGGGDCHCVYVLVYGPRIIKE
ncbi:unnamed protein product [Heligmosomoides polygyrus]|uniref:ubiquitinyl hydrolase 1 n=1 Tax=Heligmosomoides polygyrus TaxID=6339 RepID=A0A183G7N7_HELPZ|nr:unnamed protein product [Heligmosomoides polygyrus]